ncbi:YdeI/OmpD-associated family protein [Pseudohalocynthiibacter aestuariivivens]|jgi:Bacteriocin-protection, YdeI or OmpD-Associated|uniref:YdeI/OmpD-associated family protein n=1 Tax=Pseudohalocynthiibacter aestuariivivens TaxID=1591409 RepID=A0ABV5JBU9_9RHOB|nr:MULTISPECIES: YdeI/OmpD-associated family protein [Pseudohalocynthiibacter]MBS9718652.1 YdeI/OmpD-associated family protein [Pseudohalocynthiibacter aestuariivivens]MCK0104127.1 YdeI/OmpD-associated family protein [Pseudohalocynthiibacter sp. F2068]
MPDYIALALKVEVLWDFYDRRPWYQRNDYVGRIDSAKREKTKLKRLQQMLDELRAGAVYLKMTWQFVRFKMNETPCLNAWRCWCNQHLDHCFDSLCKLLRESDFYNLPSRFPGQSVP